MKQWITSESTVHQQGGLTVCSVQVLAGGGSEQCPLSSFGLAPGEGLQETQRCDVCCSVGTGRCTVGERTAGVIGGVRVCENLELSSV